MVPPDGSHVVRRAAKARAGADLEERRIILQPAGGVRCSTSGCPDDAYTQISGAPIKRRLLGALALGLCDQAGGTTFYINRAGRNLSARRRRILEAAKGRLRELYAK
jgi:hypothetical protein